MIRSDNLIPLIGGAYQARSYIADGEICENLFPEINPETSQAPTPVTHYPREGKRPLSQPPIPGPGRGIFTMSSGVLYATVGDTVYYIDADWKFNRVGQISNILTPVSIADNGRQAVLVDGTPNGYQINLNDKTFSIIADDLGFEGSNRVDFSDTFFAFSKPGTKDWILSNPNQVTFNALVKASKDSKPDPIQTIAFNIRQAWLIGTETSEVWYLAGSTPFPYQEWPSTFIPFGSAAIYSLVQADVDLFWLSRNLQGQAIAVKTKGYTVEAISTRALEYEWSNYRTVADCIGGTFQQGGHTFIVFHFPSADKTWAYDLATKQWHRRTYIDVNGVAHREKTSFYASVGPDGGYPKTVVGQDWQTGELYALDPLYYTDNGMPIVCRRTFPHVMSDMKEITSVAFVADFETGTMPDTAEQPAIVAGSPWSRGFSSAFGPVGARYNPASGPILFMRYSNNGGNTWTNYRQKAGLTAGNYRSMMRWRGLGMARDRVYELLWSFPGPSALQGAYLDPIKHSA